MIGSRQSTWAIGIRGFDQVASVEGWPLRDF